MNIEDWLVHCYSIAQITNTMWPPVQVKTAKPMVDTTAPRQHPHVTSKQKKEQVSYPIYL